MARRQPQKKRLVKATCKSIWNYPIPLSWRSRANIWSEINFENNVKSTDHFRPLNLCQNSLLLINSKQIFQEAWLQKGINKVWHLIKDSNASLSFHEFKGRYDSRKQIILLFTDRYLPYEPYEIKLERPYATKQIHITKAFIHENK